MWSFSFFNTALKVSKYGVFSGPYFPVLGLNMEIYSVNLRIQFEYRKIRTKKNSVFGHFSRSASNTEFTKVPTIVTSETNDQSRVIAHTWVRKVIECIEERMTIANS